MLPEYARAMSTPPTIRAGQARDLPSVLRLVAALAEFEKLPGPDADAVARFGADFARGRFSLFVAESDGTLVAYALYFYNYSTFLVRPSLYLEDLFVEPSARGQGLGERLMRTLAAEAVRQGCGRFEWCVLDWNVRAQKFYQSLGAELLHAWKVCRVTGPALDQLGASP
jgi:GNAT superfamily N-acetyltransferase